MKLNVTNSFLQMLAKETGIYNQKSLNLNLNEKKLRQNQFHIHLILKSENSMLCWPNAHVYHVP